MVIVHNSTFNDDELNTPTKRMWHNNCDSPVSSIEDSFNPTEIKEIVHSLVMSKFGSHYNNKILKSFSRRSTCQIDNCSSSDNSERTESNYNVKTSQKTLDFSVNTSNISDLISNVRPSTTSALENVDNVLRYLETCITLTPSMTENSSSPDENFSASEKLTSDHDSSNVSMELIDNKKLILHQTREQVLKAIHYHESRTRLTLHRERLEAERLLLITDAKVESLFYENEELTCVDNVNAFCSGSIEIYNMHLFPKQYCDEYFICVISFGSKVFASEISTVKSNGVVYFTKKIAISGLQSGFKMHVKIYSASSKALKKSNTSQSLCDYRDYNHEDDVPFRKSIFLLRGEAEIELCHLSHSGSLRKQMDFGVFTARVSSHAEVNINLSGFLNVCKIGRSHHSWDRQFCCLNEGVLNFYNYPPNQHCETTSTGIIYLETCELTVPTREQCPRKHTIFLKIEANDGVLMSFDTQYEFECWSKYLNIALSQIRTWSKC